MKAPIAAWVMVMALFPSLAVGQRDRAQVQFSLEAPSPGARIRPGGSIPWAIQLTIVGPNHAGLGGFAVDLIPEAANPAQVVFQPDPPPLALANFAAPAGLSNLPIPGSSTAFGYSGTVAHVADDSPALGLLQVGGAQYTFGSPGTILGTNALVDEHVGSGPNGIVVSSGNIIAPAILGAYTVRIHSPQCNLLRWRDEPPWASPVYPARTTIAGTGEITFEVVCLADFNRDNSVTLQDLFEYMDAWFAAAPDADVNNDQAVTLQDLFDFLDLWFVGC